MGVVASSEHARAGRRERFATLGFLAMVSGWSTFAAVAVFSEPTLGELWRGVRDLPLLVEGLAWLAFFPFVFALGIWDSSWEGWLRLVLVGCCAVGWSLAFWPRKT